MKKFLLLSLTVMIFFIFIRCNNHGGSNRNPVYKFVDTISQNIAKKYHLEFCGIGGGTTKEGVWLVNVRFSFNGKPLDIAEGRRLIITISEEFLRDFNENQEIRHFLKVYPFTIENISIGIFIQDFESNYIFHPHLDMISASNGEVGYFTRDPNNFYKFISKTYEPYLEALEKVQSEQ